MDMAFTIRHVDYFYTTVKDQPGEAYNLLALLEGVGVNLMAFTAIPIGPLHTQLALFPEETLKLQSEAKKAGLVLEGPYPALLAQGDDELGALAGIHEQLFQAHVNVYASSGVSDGQGSFGYVIYVRPEEYDRAVKALGI